MNILGGMKIMWKIFGGHQKTGLVLGVINFLCILGSFLKVNVADVCFVYLHCTYVVYHLYLLNKMYLN